MPALHSGNIPEILTPRLRLRAFAQRDLDAYADIVADEAVTRYLGDGRPLSRADAWRQMAIFNGHWTLHGFGIWAVEHRETGALVGRIGCFFPEDRPAFEIGYVLGSAFWGAGYATEGDWAQRVREAAYGGWDWLSLANGGGRTLELRNAAVDNGNGENWTFSATAGGTPGAANSALTANIEPIISDVKHSPASPRPDQAVTISCKLLDETPAAGLTATLFWRNATTSTPGAFGTVPMSGDGAGKFSAMLPSMANQTIRHCWM